MLTSFLRRETRWRKSKRIGECREVMRTLEKYGKCWASAKDAQACRKCGGLLASGACGTPGGALAAFPSAQPSPSPGTFCGKLSSHEPDSGPH